MEEGGRPRQRCFSFSLFLMLYRASLTSKQDQPGGKEVPGFFREGLLE